MVVFLSGMWNQYLDDWLVVSAESFSVPLRARMIYTKWQRNVVFPNVDSTATLIRNLFLPLGITKLTLFCTSVTCEKWFEHNCTVLHKTSDISWCDSFL